MYVQGTDLVSAKRVGLVSAKCTNSACEGAWEAWLQLHG